MSVAGRYECSLKTPLGAKSGMIEVRPSADGESFSGTLSNALLGTIAIENGTIDGDMLLCRLEIAQPMRMSAECEAIVDGDALVGFVKAGLFGKMALTGRRIA